MSYTCMNCGSTADNSNELCNPANEEMGAVFCTTSTGQVCDEKLAAMEYTCGSCGGVSSDAEHLCNPRKIVHMQTD
ncbi:hypothetical protein [Desulfobulbus elongatus]|uniref:hypothetical protein n=1 Tax=Desulfobulbus elongatus TaxID=53332 RepID=UPI0004811DCD|nr:hypothetical protein [Desulfobulbus elongatus]